MADKIREVLEKYGQVRKKGGIWIVKNEGRPSFSVEIVDANPKKTVKVSPIFGQGVSQERWFRIAEAQAKAIQEAVLKVL